MTVDVAELNELLEDSLEHGTTVSVRVGPHEYKCCGGGWQTRDYATQYTGRVLSISVDTFLLQCGNAIGKMAEVIASFDVLLDVAALVD